MLTGTRFSSGWISPNCAAAARYRNLHLAGFEFPSAAREGDRVIAISLTDSTGFERLLKGTEIYRERRMLEEMVRIIQSATPTWFRELINLFRFRSRNTSRLARAAIEYRSAGTRLAASCARPSRMQIAEALDRLPPLRHPGHATLSIPGSSRSTTTFRAASSKASA